MCREHLCTLLEETARHVSECIRQEAGAKVLEDSLGGTTRASAYVGLSVASLSAFSSLHALTDFQNVEVRVALSKLGDDPAHPQPRVEEPVTVKQKCAHFCLTGYEPG